RGTIHSGVGIIDSGRADACSWCIGGNSGAVVGKTRWRIARCAGANGEHAVVRCRIVRLPVEVDAVVPRRDDDEASERARLVNDLLFEWRAAWPTPRAIDDRCAEPCCVEDRIVATEDRACQRGIVGAALDRNVTALEPGRCNPTPVVGYCSSCTGGVGAMLHFCGDCRRADLRVVVFADGAAEKL